MDRRQVIKTAFLGGALLMLGPGRGLAKMNYATQVDENLWQGINRTADPAAPTSLEKKHSPVIKAPDKIKAGEIFPVQVAIGQVPHPMGPTHWIEYLQFNIGNQPAGEIIFRSHGYVRAGGTFNAVLDDELKGRTVSLIVQIKCNLHGIWQDYVNVDVE